MLWIAILSLYGAMSLLTLFMYGLDKHRAINNGWRIRERTLHTCELFCGWPGALAGQALFRHKRQKLRFMLVVWGIVLLHALIWIGIFWLIHHG
jgi:uncharacterized membrane protein YsdA (DUF1294 family)